MTRKDVERIVREARERGERPDLRGANLRDANLRGADLSGADLADANLRGAILSGADLADANLRGAILSGANLTDANLRGAILSGANLTGADLTSADLTGADLTGAILPVATLWGADLTGADLSSADLRLADLTGANLRDANLRGAYLPDGVPAVPNIDAAILAAVEAGGELDMGEWRSCKTTHCRAGWAIHLAGDASRDLEERFGSNVAGALIYAASGSHPTPNWFAKNEDAMADLRERARRAEKEDGA